MSRTNPYKKKRRSASRTLLMYGEGLGEEIFLKHLKSLYSRDSGVAVTVRNGRGGTALDVILNAVREPGDFNRKIVIIDNDKGSEEINAARAEAKQRGIELIENTPCLEWLLLSILDRTTAANRASEWYKHEFESNYLDKRKRTDPREFERVFPKSLLEKRRAQIAVLNNLISLMEGK